MRGDGGDLAAAIANIHLTNSNSATGRREGGGCLGGSNERCWLLPSSCNAASHEEKTKRPRKERREWRTPLVVFRSFVRSRGRRGGKVMKAGFGSLAGAAAASGREGGGGGAAALAAGSTARREESRAERATCTTFGSCGGSIWSAITKSSC